MICGYPEEGSYSVSPPPLAEVQGELNKTLASLRRVATFAHRVYRCNPSSVLHQQNRCVGVLINAVISFLRHGLDTSDEDVLARNFQLALQYMEAAHFVHAELHLRSLSSIQWFFANAAEREEGIYRLVLAHSRFSDNAPFLNVAQHAGFVAPFDNSLEPPLHCCILDRLTQQWEAMMLGYIHFLTNTPLPQAGPQEEGSGPHEEISDLQEGVGVGTATIPLFLPDPLSPTPVASPASPSPPPPLFGSVASLAIDMTADDDDDEIYKSVESIERRNCLEDSLGEDAPMGDEAGSLLKMESPAVL
ncbi:hypothetical protein F5876DRAFT_83582 [Lentinula aff. lateritia]|uniref:Uncharacterized protein n=1 Tax=Lentinula aff. lateritia TaxID=2804960 RepID=A0ACC1THP1_9AGAR|nr:hypothetical protein F5876DRAFT_83582 [Lentinula aff. lateritia]